MTPPDFEKLMAEAKKFDPDKPTDGFIREATFTNFKNIEPGTKLSFRFPITAIVGANGTGKSSILHALWGMPRGFSTSRFWFSTAVDPIAAGDTPPSYWYEHWIPKLKTFVQTRKVLGTKRHGYWEPARALPRDGMTALGPMEDKEKPYRTAERWNPVARVPLYLNFKAEFSAFDRFFYFEDGQSLEQKQDEYVKRAERLNSVVRLRRDSYKPGGRESVYENRDLTPEELEWIGFILGREYDNAQYVRHRLLGVGESPTVVFRRKGIQYSEASAGSGELAIVRAVIQLLACEKNALVLLDEPETSLHPGAQKNFLTFVLHLSRQKQLQVVMSTHSPTMVDLLPSQAVQLLEETEGAKCRIVPITHPQVAFNRLGRAVGNFLNIAVEDELLRSMVELALQHLDAGERETIRLYTPPAGASSILAHDIPVWINSKQHFYVILDGDQAVTYPDFNAMTQTEIDGLPAWILENLRTSPDHFGSDPAKALLYLKWASARLRFLNAECPELVLLRALTASPDLELGNEEAKAKLIEEMKNRGHKTDAASLSSNVSFIIGNKGLANDHIKHLADVLREFLQHHSREIGGWRSAFGSGGSSDSVPMGPAGAVAPSAAAPPSRCRRRPGTREAVRRRAGGLGRRSRRLVCRSNSRIRFQGFDFSRTPIFKHSISKDSFSRIPVLLCSIATDGHGGGGIRAGAGTGGRRRPAGGIAHRAPVAARDAPRAASAWSGNPDFDASDL